ncbi:hypothetical protein Q8F55_001153 [Vanrija albida]|uniref:Uncharacterized protein n=1 Tax=Vanrija albida TaxID=181172 RepID=A0ABR3QFA4_9TREE
MALARFALRRRRRLASLAGLGPGRPRTASSAAAEHAAFGDELEPVQRRQKMPLGSGRPSVEAEGGPSLLRGYEAPLAPAPTPRRAEATAPTPTPLPSPLPTAAAPRPPPTPLRIPPSAALPTTHASIVHAHLALGTRRTPRELVALLADRRHLITQEAVVALDALAARENDYQARLDARALLTRERLPPLPDTLRRKAGANEPKPLPGDDEANIALRYRYPPAALPDSGAVTPAAFLRHVHFCLIAKTEVPYDSAAATVRSLGNKVADQVALLDLYLGYSDDPVPLLDAFDARQPRSAKTRETLHRALLALLRAKPGKDELAALVKRFGGSGRRPGAETWRHIGRYALDADDEALAAWAFHRARDEFARVRVERARQDKLPPPALPALLAPPKFANGSPLDDVRPRFAHAGRHVTRFEWLMQAYRDKGWVERTDDPLPIEADNPDSEHFSALPRLLARWRWVGRAGEAGAPARRDARWAELAATRDLQLAVAESVARGTFSDMSDLAVTRILTDEANRPLHDPPAGAREYKRHLKLIKAAAAGSKLWAGWDLRNPTATTSTTDAKTPQALSAKKKRWKVAKAKATRAAAPREPLPHVQPDADAAAAADAKPDVDDLD